jgi:hypothetical protein
MAGIQFLDRRRKVTEVKKSLELNVDTRDDNAHSYLNWHTSVNKGGSHLSHDKSIMAKMKHGEVLFRYSIAYWSDSTSSVCDA